MLKKLRVQMGLEDDAQGYFIEGALILFFVWMIGVLLEWSIRTFYVL